LIFALGTVLVPLLGVVVYRTRPVDARWVQGVLARLRRIRATCETEIGRYLAAAAILLALAGATVVVAWPIGRMARRFVKDIDQPVFRWNARHMSTHGAWHHFNSAATLTGSVANIQIATVVGIVVFAILWARRGWWIPPMLMAVAFIFEKFGQMLLSAVVARPSLPLPGWGSYPSGGVARILVTYGMIMYLVVLTWPRISRAWRVTGFTVVVMLAWIESFTRIYVQKHYLMDVLGGWIFGPLFLLALIAGASCFRQVDATTGTDEAIDRENAAV
jgi:hypothetical protein